MAAIPKSPGSNLSERMAQLYVLKSLEQDEKHLNYFNALQKLAIWYENANEQGRHPSAKYGELLQLAEKYLSMLQAHDERIRTDSSWDPTQNPARVRRSEERLASMEEKLVERCREVIKVKKQSAPQITASVQQSSSIFVEINAPNVDEQKSAAANQEALVAKPKPGFFSRMVNTVSTFVAETRRNFSDFTVGVMDYFRRAAVNPAAINESKLEAELKPEPKQELESKPEPAQYDESRLNAFLVEDESKQEALAAQLKIQAELKAFNGPLPTISSEQKRALADDAQLEQLIRGEIPLPPVDRETDPLPKKPITNNQYQAFDASMRLSPEDQKKSPEERVAINKAFYDNREEAKASTPNAISANAGYQTVPSNPYGQYPTGQKQSEIAQPENTQPAYKVGISQGYASFTEARRAALDIQSGELGYASIPGKDEKITFAEDDFIKKVEYFEDNLAEEKESINATSIVKESDYSKMDDVIAAAEMRQRAQTMQAGVYGVLPEIRLKTMYTTLPLNQESAERRDRGGYEIEGTEGLNNTNTNEAKLRAEAVAPIPQTVFKPTESAEKASGYAKIELPSSAEILAKKGAEVKAEQTAPSATTKNMTGLGKKDWFAVQNRDIPKDNVSASNREQTKSAAQMPDLSKVAKLLGRHTEIIGFKEQLRANETTLSNAVVTSQSQIGNNRTGPK